jgi:hypothetical protein
MRLDPQRHGWLRRGARTLRWLAHGHRLAGANPVPLQRLVPQEEGRPPCRPQTDHPVARTIAVDRLAPATPELRRLFRGVERFACVDVFVHGSWADATRTPFSDLDDLVIVDAARIAGAGEARRLERWLNRVDMRFCRLDPLQHHGHWLVYRDLLEAYDASYMPLCVLDGALRVQGGAEIVYRIDAARTRAGLRRNIIATCASIDRLGGKYLAGRINTWQMKALVGSFLIMPAYVFQLRGAELAKPAAIGRAAELFSAGPCALLDACTAIRAGWGVVTRRPGHGLLRLAAALARDPHLFRWCAARLAPRFPRARLARLQADHIHAFREEALRHADCG